MEQSPLSTHCILELHGCSPSILNDALFIRDAIEEASKQGLSTLLKVSSHQFAPHGVTVVGLLAESHISVHTWPEHGYAAVDMFTCGECADPRRACDYLVRQFDARDHKLLVLQRGIGVQDGELEYPQELLQEREACQVRA